jgi:hypothetical protein
MVYTLVAKGVSFDICRLICSFRDAFSRVPVVDYDDRYLHKHPKNPAPTLVGVGVVVLLGVMAVDCGIQLR